MWKEFRDFLLRGNVIELAVAVVIGGAFGALVSRFVEDILTPLTGLFGLPDFSSATLVVGKATFKWGDFLNGVVSFVLVGLAIFFFVVRPLERLATARRKKEAAEPLPPTELTVLQEIRDELRSQRETSGRPAAAGGSGSVELRSEPEAPA